MLDTRKFSIYSFSYPLIYATFVEQTYFVPGTFLGIEITELRTDQKVGWGREGAGAVRSLYLSRSGNY